MRQFEVFDGDRYLFTVMPSENPRDVLQEERRNLRNAGLRMVMIDKGIRTQVEGPGNQLPRDPEDEMTFDGGDE